MPENNLTTKRNTTHSRIDITNLKVGMLTVLKPLYPNKWQEMLWECICECGNVYIGRVTRLKRQDVGSCGCQEGSGTHGLSRTPAYGRWASMMHRCHNPQYFNYPNWGGRGITVCERWHSVESFVADMGQPPKGLTIERINNANGYWCGKCEECLSKNREANCKWDTMLNQSKNKRSNHPVTANGKTMIVKDWVRETGIAKSTILNRLKNDWSEQDAVTIPPRSAR